MKIDRALIERLSAQPLLPADWFVRLHGAAQLLFGAGGLALVERHDAAHCGLVALVGAGGEVVTAAPERLQLAPACRPDIVLPCSAAPTWSPLAAAGPAALAAHTGAFVIPWPLGSTAAFEFVVLPAPGHGPVTPAAEIIGAFLQIAGNHLRRIETHALIHANAWIEDEIMKVAALQELLRPEAAQSIAGMDYAVFTRPQRYAGGDYYDISPLFTAGGAARPGLCAIGIADVSGHGPAAVVETAMIDTCLRTYRDVAPHEARPGPAAVANYLNRHMFTRRARPSFATVFLSVWNAEERRLRFTCAGHPPPLLRRAHDGTVAAIATGNDIPIQVLREYCYSEQVLALESGDVLVLYTDGITEALSPGGEQFGLARLAAAIAGAETLPVALLAAVTAALDEHSAGVPTRDDQTLLALRFA